jgi:hypothetical protein
MPSRLKNPELAKRSSWVDSWVDPVRIATPADREPTKLSNLCKVKEGN